MLHSWFKYIMKQLYIKPTMEGEVVHLIGFVPWPVIDIDLICVWKLIKNVHSEFCPSDEIVEITLGRLAYTYPLSLKRELENPLWFGVYHGLGSKCCSYFKCIRESSHSSFRFHFADNLLVFQDITTYRRLMLSNACSFPFVACRCFQIQTIVRKL